MTDTNTTTPVDQVRALYEQAESQTAQNVEELVSTRSFGRLIAMAGENFAAVARISSDATDMAWRNLRVAGRADITRLARQLHRTEDKLERVLQEVEQLRDELAAARRETATERNGALAEQPQPDVR